ncbi:flagellar biosynthetic protein FliO [Sporosarcina sp. ACRSL]|uniref:flagellar biosynthetic protein FliO n=1 Tax=Sporosarcina sp. ACRSL TaxID=2918215 RepID=UPI001EF4430B|nr:flagellar biosynthetic protein FliO [Sporosarcina sp. ACRSL]MCG7342880.1 flagellar biosynthetic protein FliO [Sporosarcina sp. ACRSL]
MRVSINLKRLLPLFIVLFVMMPFGNVHAEADQNKSVSDCLGQGNDCGQDSKNVNEIDEPAADTSQDGAAVGLSLWDYIKTLFALLFVIGLLLALLKFINRKNRMFDQHRFIKNVGGLSLGQHKSIQLVVIGDSYYLIGVGDEVRLLKEITDPKEIKALESYFDEDELQSPPGIMSKLLTMLPQNKADTSLNSDEPADFKKMFITRLDELRAERKKHLNRLAEKERKKDE